jgi:hypothetical protein
MPEFYREDWLDQSTKGQSFSDTKMVNDPARALLRGPVK